VADIKAKQRLAEGGMTLKLSFLSSLSVYLMNWGEEDDD